MTFGVSLWRPCESSIWTAFASCPSSTKDTTLAFIALELASPCLLALPRVVEDLASSNSVDHCLSRAKVRSLVKCPVDSNIFCFFFPARGGRRRQSLGSAASKVQRFSQVVSVRRWLRVSARTSAQSSLHPLGILLIG